MTSRGFAELTAAPYRCSTGANVENGAAAPLATGSDIRYLHIKVFTNRNETPAQHFLFYFIFIH